ncbi:MAG: glycosyltransferase family 1 protein [Lysobacteraceae bacterium]|nr:MAG: glycosyltransferase family 1 protein [Xanthomonadaceae bacterium]
MTESASPFGTRGIVYFGNDWLAENRTSSHHVASRLARIAPLLYVSSPGLRAPQASGRDLGRMLRKLRASLRAPREVAPGLWHCTVPQLPFRRIPGVDALNRAFGRWAVRRAMRAAGIDRCISWFVVPHPGFLAGRLGEDLCVYYCIDDYAAHPGVDADLIGRRDAELSRRADVVFVAPPTLLAPKQTLNPHTIAAPHGVDVELFARAADAQTDVAAGARALARPVVGYFGSLHAWIDFELLEWLARARPLWTFLLVGHVAADTGALAGLPNVHLAGAQPYASLPGWAKAFDVAIIPYRLNRQVANANPLKLREYLATGKPVVSVRNAEIEKFARWVRIADDREEFLAAIERALAEDSPTASLERRAAVADQTWDRRVEEVVGHVADALARRSA